MNPSAFFIQPPPRQTHSTGRNRAFTLAELAVVIVTIALLAMVVVPALAGVQNKAGRMQCAANLRQVYAASMIYANAYRDWLPPCTVGAANTGGRVNNLEFLDYTLYVYLGTANAPVPTNAPSGYSTLGFLYQSALAGNGLIFFCPDQSGTKLGANYYQPLLSANLVLGSGEGAVQSSYAFNPRIVDATNNIIARSYQKTSDLAPHKLFAVDFFGGGSGVSSFSSINMPHVREGGWNVLFTDGSVQFSRDAQANNAIQNFIDQEGVASNEAANQIFNLLELDH